MIRHFIILDLNNRNVSPTVHNKRNRFYIINLYKHQRSDSFSNMFLFLINKYFQSFSLTDELTDGYQVYILN